jgi:hypothetical protein
MASSLAKLRDKIEVKVFQSIASDAIITRISTSTDKYGDATTTLVSSSAIKSVPYNMIDTESFEPFGDLQAGELDIVLPYHATFDVDDFIDFDGNRYIIKVFEKYPYQNGTLAYAVRVARVL